MDDVTDLPGDVDHFVAVAAAEEEFLLDEFHGSPFLHLIDDVDPQKRAESVPNRLRGQVAQQQTRRSFGRRGFSWRVIRCRSVGKSRASTPR